MWKPALSGKQETGENMYQNRTKFSRRAFVSGITGFAALGAVSVAAPSAAFADTAAEKQAEAEQAYASLCDMQQQLDIASNNYTASLFELESAEQRMEECEDQIEEKTTEIEGYQEKLSTRARSMYRSGGNTFMDVVLGASTFQEFASNMDMLMEMNDQDARLVERTKEARETLEAAKVEYAEQERVAKEKTEETARIKEEAETTVAEMQAVYDNLSAEAAELLEAERKAAEEEAARQAAAVVAASAAEGGEYQASPENQAFNGDSGASASDGSSTDGAGTADDGGDAGGAGTTGDTGTTDDGGSSGTSEGDTGASSGGAVYEGGGDTVSRAYACLGAPYGWGAVGPGAYDCSGLVSYCLTGSHTRLGTTNTFMGWSQVSDPQPGDVCTSSYHCGIYIGSGQMIHAADYGIGVIVGPVQSDMIIVRW